MSAEFWVGVGFFIFIGILGVFGVHKTLIKGLDAHAGRVTGELAEAKRLRLEAEKLLADYEKRRTSAEQEAASLIVDAQAEAERISIAAKASVEDFVKRRTIQAELKITQAETSAMADVKISASNAAIEASRLILVQQMNEKTASLLFSAGLDDVKKSLHS